MKKVFAQILVIALLVCFAASASASDSIVHLVDEVLQDKASFATGELFVITGYVTDIRENSFRLVASRDAAESLLVYVDDPESKAVLEEGRFIFARGYFLPEYEGNFYSNGIFHFTIHHQIG